MSDYTDLAKTIVDLTKGKIKKSPKGYDTKGIVNRVDTVSKKAYVHFYGGVDETPVDLTINCSKGDIVQVRVSGGRAWIVGNQTAPPTDDKAVNILNHTVNNLRNQLDKTKEELEEEIEEIEPGEGKLIERIATEYILSEFNYLVDDEVVPYEPTPGEPMEWSEELPDYVSSPKTYYWTRTVIYYTDGTVDEQDPFLDQNAQITAEVDYAIDSDNNRFWHDSTGAYVTEEGRTLNDGYATRITNSGILQTYDGKLMSAWTNSGVSFYGSEVNDQNPTLLSSFGIGGITFNTSIPFTIGNTTGQNPSYIRWINTGTDLSPNWKLQICADTIQFGSDSTDISDVVNPYEIETNVESIVANTDSGTTTPASVTVYLKKAGSSESGYLYVEKTTNGTSWSQHYGPSQSATFTVPLSSDSSIKFYRFSWYEESAMTNLKNSKTIPVIATGEEGAGIDDTTITYATSSSYSTPPSSGWQSTPPYVSQGYYLWTKTIFSYSDGTSSDPVYSVARQGVNGQNGTDITSQYVTYISDNYGVRVHHAGTGSSFPYLQCNADGVSLWNDSSHYSIMTSSSFDVYIGNTTYPVAEFGSAIILGPSNSKHVRVTGNEIDYYNSSGSLYAYTYLNPSDNSLILNCMSSGANSKITLKKDGNLWLTVNGNSKMADLQMSTTGCDYISSNYTSNEAQMCVSTSDSDAEASSGVWFGIGSGGKNHGLYSEAHKKWIIYADTGSPDVFLPIAGARTVTSSATAAYLTSGGRLTRTSSSRRYKHDISDISEPILDPKKLYGLRAVQFKFNEDVVPLGDYMYEKFVPGFIAEEVAEVYPRAAVRDADNAYQIEDWDARYIIPPMLALIQDQKKMIDDLEERVSALEGGLQ